MSITKGYQQKNQKKIVETLNANDKTLTLLELKNKSQLANLYFFQALNQLEQNKIIERKKKDNQTLVTLKIL